MKIALSKNSSVASLTAAFSLVLLMTLTGGSKLVAQEGQAPEAVAKRGWVKNQGGSRVIVFVHGLFSGPEAWRCDSKHYWPEMIANDSSAAFSDTDVYVVKYATPRRGGSMTMADIETSIVNELEAEGIFRRYKSVVFVAHSMGGLLTQQILTTYVDKGLRAKVPAILLYGTPQEGSKVAKLASLFNNDPKLKELASGDGNFILPDEDLRWLHMGSPRIDRFCAYETRNERGFKVVGRDSATRGCDDIIAIDANHQNLVKPCSTESASYTFLKNKIGSLPLIDTPHISTPFSTPQLSTGGPYSDTQLHIDRLRQMDREWESELSAIERSFYSPYKQKYLSGNRDPWPTHLSDSAIDSVAEQEHFAIANYEAFSPSLVRTRQIALECMKLTPNQITKDDQEFSTADRMARHLVPHSKLDGVTVERGRFGSILQYEENLHKRLGDYRCAAF